jgi:hypothetical protein
MAVLIVLALPIATKKLVSQVSPSDLQRWMYCITTTGRETLCTIPGTAAMRAGPIRLQLSHDFKANT